MHSIFDKKVKLSPSHKCTKKSPDQPYLPEDDENNASWEWYDPPEDSPPVNFFMDTSLHGLQYLGQRKRHLCERIFWLTAFTAAVITAAYLIGQMWVAYLSMPIVTVFNPSEKTLNEIPFPAVTICNVNNIQKSKMEDLKRKANQGVDGSLPDNEFLPTLASLVNIYHICEAGKTFTKRFVQSNLEEEYASFRDVMRERLDEYVNLSNPTGALRKYSQPCTEMILFCVWQDSIHNCSDLFQEIETDYGYCCSFNTIPLSLLMKDSDDERDDPKRVEEWRKANIDYDKLIFNEETKDRKYPERQQYPGRSAGLSILLNPDLDEYYCTNTDSEGFVVALNVPLDFPRMRDNGIAIRTNSEIFISIRPEITMSDETTKQFSMKDRQCYFSDEKALKHYTKYTSSNCMDECIAKKTLKRCKCIRYYMPSRADEILCRSQSYNCTENVREEVIRKGLGNICKSCHPTCTEIVYHTETTTLGMQQQQVQNLFKKFSEFSTAHNVSILHVYFNVDSTYPRLRKEMTTVINLISNAGGLLGLCMGFSMLSLLEIIYHATIRLFCKSYRQRIHQQRNGHHSCDENLKENEHHTIKLIKFSNGKRNGFLSKVLHWGSLDTEIPNTTGGRVALNKVKQNLGEIAPPTALYFRKPIGSHFQEQEPYLKTAWLPVPEVVEGDKLQ